MSASQKKTDAQLFNGFANVVREYRAAWAKHGSPDGCTGIALEADMTLEDIQAALAEVRKDNDSCAAPTLGMIFFEEFLEMIEAAYMGNIKAYKTELAQCHAVLERIDDWITAHGEELRKGAANG